MSYELRQLRLFILVCQHGSIAAAARAAHIAQPALSRHIQALEQQLEAQLLERLPRGIRLTKAGEELYQRATALLEQAQAIQEQVRLSVQGLTGSLRIGVMPAYAHLPQLSRSIAALRQESPEIRVQVEQLLSAQQFAALANGKLDIGIAAWRPAADTTLHGKLIMNDSMVLALPVHDPLAQETSPLALKALRHHTLIGFPREYSTIHYDALREALQTAGLQLHQAPLSCSDSYAALGLVAGGLGYAVVPQFFQHLTVPNVAFRPVQGLELSMRVELLHSMQGHSALRERFLMHWSQNASTF